MVKNRLRKKIREVVDPSLVFKYEKVVSRLPFILFLTFLAALYISNNHKAVIYVGKIARLEGELEELSWEYETVHSELTHKSTISEVAKMVDTMGLRELEEPQYKIVVEKDGR